MRDISDFQVQNRGLSNKYKKLLPFVGVLVLVLLVLFVLKQIGNSSSSGSSQVVLREAPRGLTPVQIESSNINISAEGVDLTTQRTNLRDVKYGGDASAKASRSFGGGTYILSVNATLPDPKNTYYQVWLVGGGEVVPIDYMRGSKTNWSLSLRGEDNYSSFDEIWITLERTKDELSEEHVMEGRF